WWKGHWDMFVSVCHELRDQLWLHRNVPRIRDGDFVKSLCLLLRQARENSQGVESETLNWRKLEKRYGRIVPWLGRRIVKATQSGCVSVWERYCPETKEPTYGGEAGLVGIECLLTAAKLDFRRLDPSEAHKAARYAMQDSNNFPDWLALLTQHQPDAVKSVLQEYIADEWLVSSNSQGSPQVLWRINNDERGLANLVAPFVAARLRERDPANHRVLHITLSLLARTGTLSANDLAQLASERIICYRSNEEHYQTWLAIWTQTDAAAAIRHIEATLLPPHEADSMGNQVVLLCAHLQDPMVYDKPLLTTQSYREPPIAEQFIRLVYRYVAPEQDLHREGGFSPVARDEAQRFRRTLIAVLGGNSSPDADSALRNLSTSSELAGMRDEILELLDERAERMADASWTEGDVRRFASDREAMATTLEDLFHVVLRRLSGIKHDVEDAEESIRDEMNPQRGEAGLQTFLVRKLRERNNGRYTAPKEPQIDGGERADIQIHAPGVEGHVQVEIKLGDMSSRSLSSLLADLEHQLLGKYLRDRTSTHGIFVVGFSGTGSRQTWRDPASQESLSFEQVISALHERVQVLATNTAGLKSLQVVGIDFRLR
ncbi:MAG: hypothetical protein U0984_05910, partial [Prosthecobacter sp.]|nr:hypothetical protein [Prosthecobacter sp.]